MAKLFFSYSHKDEDLRNELEIHLSLLKRQGVITSWHDRRITAGSDINQSISSELESSHIILLLISAYFLDSDYCYEKEMKRALEKHNEKSAVVVPVILHPCDWHSAPFGHLKATPTDGKAVTLYANQQEAFAIVAQDVREAVNSLPTQKSVSDDYGLHEDLDTPMPQGDRSSNLRIKRTFNDHEQDEFLEDSYEYIARYFHGSLQELSSRNPQINSRLKRVDETSFEAFIYENGKRVAQCYIWFSVGNSIFTGIAYSQSYSSQRNSYNEILNVVDDGYTLQLKAMGLQLFGDIKEKAVSQQGAAEYYWSLFIKPLQ